MASKVKCIDCAKSMHWAMPCKVTEENYQYAKYCLEISKRSLVCGENHKTKRIEHEQYCKKYCKKTELDLCMDKVYIKEISDLEQMISDFEQQKKEV